MSNEAIDWAYRQECPSPGAKSVLVALANMADSEHSCYPGQRRLSVLTGQGERSVRRKVAELEASGLLRRSRRFDSHGHRTSDHYVLAVIPTGQSGHWPIWPEAKVTTGQSDQRPKTTSLPANLTAPTGQIGRVNQREPSEEPTDTRARLSKSEIAAAFDEFWKAYPRRVGKRGAQAEFERALKRAATDIIIGGAKRYRDDPNREDQFTKHPSTWLHQDCWADDPLPSRNGRQAQVPDYWKGAS